MGRSKSFKDEFAFEDRFQESSDIIARYPDRVPVVVERFTKTDLPEMEKKKRPRRVFFHDMISEEHESVIPFFSGCR